MALTGALVGYRCFASQSAAQDYIYSAFAPVVMPNGDLVSFSFSSGFWERLVTTPALVVSRTSAPLLDFPACDPSLAFADGLQFSGLLIGVCVTAILFGLISRAK